MPLLWVRFVTDRCEIHPSKPVLSEQIRTPALGDQFTQVQQRTHHTKEEPTIKLTNQVASLFTDGLLASRFGHTNKKVQLDTAPTIKEDVIGQQFAESTNVRNNIFWS